MSDRFQTEPFTAPALTISHKHPPLPGWLASRLFGPDEQIVWVRGPWFTPSWERYATHPSLLLPALLFAWALLMAARLIAGGWGPLLPVVLVAGGTVVLTLFVLGISAGYF